MRVDARIHDRILEAVRWYPGCSLDELTAVCPDLTWNQVFLAVDEMSRSRRLRIILNGGGIYTVWDQLEPQKRSRELDRSGHRRGSGRSRGMTGSGHL